MRKEFFLQVPNDEERNSACRSVVRSGFFPYPAEVRPGFARMPRPPSGRLFSRLRRARAFLPFFQF